MDTQVESSDEVSGSDIDARQVSKRRKGNPGTKAQFSGTYDPCGQSTFRRLLML